MFRSCWILPGDTSNKSNSGWVRPPLVDCRRGRFPVHRLPDSSRCCCCCCFRKESVTARWKRQGTISQLLRMQRSKPCPKTYCCWPIVVHCETDDRIGVVSTAEHRRPRRWTRESSARASTTTEKIHFCCCAMKPTTLESSVRPGESS
jgi:hypothetical protein